MPKSHTSNNLAKAQFDKRDFRYLPEKDEYRCPAGERAIWRIASDLGNKVETISVESQEVVVSACLIDSLGRIRNRRENVENSRVS